MFQLLHASAQGIPALGTEDTLFQFGTEHFTALLANVSSVVNSFWPIALFIIGLAVAIWVVSKIVGIFRARAR